MNEIYMEDLELPESTELVNDVEFVNTPETSGTNSGAQPLGMLGGIVWLQ